jgi:hypothetical protein
MPFGVHKGRLVDDVPTSYLLWMLRECDLKAYLRTSIERVLADRERSQREPSPPPPGQKVLALTDLRARVKAWFGQLAMLHHPDRGGSVEAMRVVNDCHERLCKALEIRDMAFTGWIRSSVHSPWRRVCTAPTGHECARKLFLLAQRLPKGFVRIRHYGLLAGVNVATKLEGCRRLLGAADRPKETAPAKTWVERVLEWTGQDPRCCPRCQGPLTRCAVPPIAPGHGGDDTDAGAPAVPPPATTDSS